MDTLNTLIQQIINRNKEIQQKKSEGVGGWFTSIVLALISFVGIGLALWLSSRRNKELARARTELEEAKLRQEQVALEAHKIPLKKKREGYLAALKHNEIILQQRTKEIKQAEEAYKIQKKKISGLHTWKEINEV